MDRRECQEQLREEQEQREEQRENATPMAAPTTPGEIITLDKLDVDDDNFRPTEGFVLAKRTVKGANGTNETRVFALPVSTAGLDKFMREMLDQMPKPPARDKWIDPKSEIGQEMGLTKKQIMTVPDHTDEKYQKRASEHGEKMIKRGVGLCVACPLFYRTPSGEKKQAETPEEKAAALEALGFTMGDFRSLNEQIGRLMSWTEDEMRRFFGVS